MSTILFLHGFYASGQCVPAKAIKDAFEGRAEVITPDLPLHPKEAIAFIRELCDHEQPDIIVGNSCGSFYAQMIAPIIGVPALLGNPHFKMTEFLQSRIGAQQYKSPRANGVQNFIINEALIREFAELEAEQFSCCNPYYKDRIWGIFGEQDTLAHFEPLFLEHYNNTFHFPGGHTPTEQETKAWYVPMIEKIMMTYPKKEGWVRYFQHFKGNKYRFIHSAFDSETRERVVVYQALYGDRQYWVRPEHMFFEIIERDGKRFNRFTEINWKE